MYANVCFCIHNAAHGKHIEQSLIKYQIKKICLLDSVIKIRSRIIIVSLSFGENKKDTSCYTRRMPFYLMKAGEFPP